MLNFNWIDSFFMQRNKRRIWYLSSNDIVLIHCSPSFSRSISSMSTNVSKYSINYAQKISIGYSKEEKNSVWENKQWVNEFLSKKGQ